MNKILFIFCILILSSACTNEQTKPLIDVEQEFSSQPEIKISWAGEDGTNKEMMGSSGSFCSNVMCFDQGIPSPASFSYSEYENGAPITVAMKTANGISVNSIFITLKDTDFKTIQTLAGEGSESDMQSGVDPANGSNTYTYKTEKTFKETGNLILHVKIKWDGGYATSYFPLIVN